MRDLRNGVKLKKVQERQYNPLPIEYQLTPYEMLMDDIRSKRYTLRKVMVSSVKINFVIFCIALNYVRTTKKGKKANYFSSFEKLMPSGGFLYCFVKFLPLE